MILAVVQDREQIQMKQYELTSRQEMEIPYLFTTIINGAYKKEKKLENILNILLGTFKTYIPGAR